MDSLSFLETVAGATQPPVDQPVTRLATIDPAFSAASFMSGTNPKVTFDTESALSGKTYPVLSPYWPFPGDRVVMVPVGHTYVIAGSIDADAHSTTKLPFVKVQDSGTGQTLNNGSPAPLTFDTVVTDDFGYVNTTARIKPNIPGWHRFVGTLFVPSRTGGYDTLSVKITKVGTAIAPVIRVSEANAPGSRSVQVVTSEWANGTTDYFEVLAQQDNAGAANVVLPTAGDFTSVFECSFLSGMP